MEGHGGVVTDQKQAGGRGTHAGRAVPAGKGDKTTGSQVPGIPPTSGREVGSGGKRLQEESPGVLQDYRQSRCVSKSGETDPAESGRGPGAIPGTGNGNQRSMLPRGR